MKYFWYIKDGFLDVSGLSARHMAFVTYFQESTKQPYWDCEADGTADEMIRITFHYSVLLEMACNDIQ